MTKTIEERVAYLEEQLSIVCEGLIELRKITHRYYTYNQILWI